MTTKTNKKFNAQTATLVEINRELKRLASVKCRNKDDQDKYDAAVKEIDRINDIKNQRFGEKHYIDWSADEIANASFSVAKKAVKSLQSAKTLYPHRLDEILPKLNEWMERRDSLKELEHLKELASKHGMTVS